MPSLDSVIRVTTEIAEAAADAEDRFGGALVVTLDANVLAASGEHKIGHYASLAAVANDGFVTTSEPYRAAAAYFGQSPAPSRLSIARWAKARVPSEVVGGSPSPIATITASATRLVSGTGATGSLTLPTSRSGDDLVGIGGDTAGITITEEGSTAATAIATALQAAFRGESFTGASGITVTIEGANATARFVITVPAGVSIRSGGLTGNLADALGFIAGDNPRYEAPYTMSVGGNEETVNAILSGNAGVLVNTQTAVATALRTALQAESATGYGTLTVTYDSPNSRFEIGDGTTTGAVSVLTVGTGALADAMGLSVSGGAEVHTGSAEAETAAEFIAAVSALPDDNWYWIVLENGLYDTADAEAFSAAVESTRKQLILDSTSAAVLNATAGNATVDVAAKGRARTSVVWSATADYKAAALAGQFAARDLNRAGTALTAKFRPLTGRAADSLAPAQITSLNTQRINYYTEFGGAAILAEGVATAAGRFIETQHWIDWFTHEVQTGIYNLLRASNQVPQTATGISQLDEVVIGVCEQGLANGGITPGVVGSAVTNAIRSEASLPAFDGELPVGYLTYIAPVTSLTETQRAAGNVPPIRVWVKGSGAVHFVDLDLTFGG